MKPVPEMTHAELIAELGRLTVPVDYPDPSVRIVQRISDIRSRLGQMALNRARRAGKDAWRLAMGDSL